MQQNKPKQLVIGVDPGSGSKSNTGIAIIDPSSMDILYVDELAPTNKYDNTDTRIFDIVTQYGHIIDDISSMEVLAEDVLVIFEYFVMKGKGGEVLNRLIGGIIGRTKFETHHVFNLNVKKIVTGFGGSDDKKAVGRGLETFFSHNKESLKKVKELTEEESWDKIDALAIAISGYKEYLNAPKRGKSKKSNR